MVETSRDLKPMFPGCRFDVGEFEGGEDNTSIFKGCEEIYTGILDICHYSNQRFVTHVVVDGFDVQLISQMQPAAACFGPCVAAATANFFGRGLRLICDLTP